VIVETPHLREQWRKGWLKGSYAIDRAVARCVNHFVAVSEAQRRYLVEEKGLRPEKVVVIRNGADLRRFEAAHQSPDGWRARLGLEEGDPVVVVLARLDPQKGHHVLLDALPQVCNEFPRLRVFCVGDGTLRQELCQRVRDLALDNCVRFVGYQTQTADWLALADFTVLPSHFEGLPIAAIESLAMEKPMVATAVDGTAEVVLDGKTGLTVPPGQPNRLAEAICRLLRDSDLRRRLGGAGRDWVKRHFSQEEQVRKTGELYLRALERCAGRVESPRTLPPRGEVCASSAKAASDGQRATSG
jgi:glycosyltransferase involved in cell wall biosynthesis